MKIKFYPPTSRWGKSNFWVTNISVNSKLNYQVVAEFEPKSNLYKIKLLRKNGVESTEIGRTDSFEIIGLPRIKRWATELIEDDLTRIGELDDSIALLREVSEEVQQLNKRLTAHRKSRNELIAYLMEKGEYPISTIERATRMKSAHLYEIHKKYRDKIWIP